MLLSLTTEPDKQFQVNYKCNFYPSSFFYKRVTKIQEKKKKKYNIKEKQMINACKKYTSTTLGSIGSAKLRYNM